ncbi:DUF7667 family protein [Paenibacillus sambharensis]|uniref:DUF7667 family protein n=1 Tax=Paenibacillus sambharensis TaxID=1803190 RepID=UPI0015E89ACB|nr:hypothetical protein [Paenibacillus sambharensis]
MPILPVHERLAELWVLRQSRQLTAAEQTDYEHCLAFNASYCRELAHLKNMSLLASMTSDTQWQHELCGKIEKLSRR